jgi:hypothetical protein
MKKEKSRKMTPRRKQAITYLIASAPMLWWGGSQFEVGGHDKLMAIGLSISLTFGMLFAICGLVMLFTTKKLGVLEPMKEPSKKEEVFIMAGDLVPETTSAIRLAPEQQALFADSYVMSSEMIKSFRELGDTVNAAHTERADIRATLNSRGILINEEGNIEVI